MHSLLFLNPESASELDVQSYKRREAARGVVLNEDGLIALLHVSRDGYYKLPGGGIDAGETPEMAMRRECLEEIGHDIEIIQALGVVTEFRKMFGLKQVSHCYLARAVGEQHALHFTEHEKECGFEPPVWTSLEDALHTLEHCTPTAKEGKEYIVPRDIAILKAARAYV